MAAKVSALLEAAELAVAERLPLPAERASLAALDPRMRSIWSEASRPAHAIRLNPALSREWVEGRCLFTGQPTLVPWDLLSLDLTICPQSDAFASSSGLATGNTQAEAKAGAIAEVLERDLTAAFWQATRRERRACEVDPNSVDDRVVRPLLARIGAAGFDVRLWSIGDQAGVPAMRCALIAPGVYSVLPPTMGSGCHPSRQAATLRAVLEAVQVYATLVAGARDDLEPDHYSDPDTRRRDLLWETLGLARAERSWLSVAESRAYAPSPDSPARSLDLLLAAAARRTALPVIGLEHPGFVAGLTVFRVLAPGLTDLARAPPVAEPVPFPSLRAAGRPGPSRPRARRPLVFVGPSLSRDDVPPGIEAHPPAVAGDLARLLGDPPPAVGLIDGCFETAPTVWHKEILHLLAVGVPVLGAASLGALRAAELDGMGMRGIGQVYAAYRDGVVVRDDAVMLPHAPSELGYRPLGVSLVDMEATLEAAGLLATDRRRLQRIARRLHHGARSWERCLARFAVEAGHPAPVTAASLAAFPSIKRADALALVAALPDAARCSPRPLPPLTSHYRRLLARITPVPP